MTREEWDKLTPDERWAAFQKAGASFGSPLRSMEIRWEPAGDMTFPPGWPPLGMIGDIAPTFYDGKWWVDSLALLKRKIANGDAKP
jgi:hypothetical protein